MRFTEIDLLGVYVAPISLMMVTIGLRRGSARVGVLRHVWDPAMFVFAIRLIVLSTIVLAAAAR